ncbi:hypothetical protein OSTOST_09313, partial [Ostertagia ostertagi]
MKLDVSIQPIGKLRCMDVATCGRECFYCDFCKESRLVLIGRCTSCLQLANLYRQQKVSPTFTLINSVCRSVWQKDYWQKQGAVDVWMKFYERGHTRPELEKEFFAQIDNPLLGKAFKLAIVAEWLAANSLDIPNILKDKKCAAFERLQEDRFQQEAHAFKKQTGGGNFLSGLNGFLNTVRG